MKVPQNPIFIVGYPRSGTTLLQRMLAAQPDIYTFPETHYFNVIEKEIRWDREAAGEAISPDSLPAILEKIYEKMELRFSESEKNCLYTLATNKILSSKSLFEMIVSHCLYAVHSGIHDESSFRWVEKTPNHAHFLQRIQSMYPDAQFLHILRHPVPAVCSRKLKFPFNKEMPLDELARRWIRVILDVETFAEKNGNNIFSLRYEDLVEDLSGQLGAAATFLNIDIDIRNLAFLKGGNNPKTEQFILPSERWKLDDLEVEMAATNHHYQNLLNSEEIRAIEKITTGIMSRYGYEPFQKGIR